MVRGFALNKFGSPLRLLAASHSNLVLVPPLPMAGLALRAYGSRLRSKRIRLAAALARRQPFEPCSRPASADGGTRTRTALSGQRILSPLRLPFRHIGARAEPNEAARRQTASAISTGIRLQ
jgi:hypothetical protein